MYAVIETGGKQVRVQAGDIIQVEKLTGDVGAQIVFDKVLFVSNLSGTSTESSEVILGQPYVDTAKVEAEILAQGRDKKVMIVKMKRRKQYRRTQGHRQEQTQLLVTALTDGSKKIELSSAEKKVKMTKFFTNLKAKGPASQAKTLGSRVRAKKAKLAAGATGTAKTKTTAAKTTVAKTSAAKSETAAPKAAKKPTKSKA